MNINLKSLLVAIAAFACLNVEAAFAADYTIKFAHPAPTGDPAHKAAEYFADKIAARTNGQVEVKIFPGGQLGNSQEVTQGMQSGAIEMAFFSSTHLVNFVPEFGVLDLPFLVTKKEEVGRLLEGQIGKELMAKLPAIGIRGLAFSECSFRSVFTEEPVESLEDLKGLKLRVPNSPVYVAIAEAMGALPTPIAFNELYSALQQGVVDGAENTPTAYWTYKFYEVGPHWTVTNHTILPGVYLMSEKFWDSLPPVTQKIVEDTAYETGLYHRKIEWEKGNKGLSLAQQNGAEVHKIEDLSPLVEKARERYDELAKKIGKDIVQRAVAMFSESP